MRASKGEEEEGKGYTKGDDSDRTRDSSSPAEKGGPID